MAYPLTLSALFLVHLYGCVQKVFPTELAGHSFRRLGSLTLHCISTMAAQNPSFSLPGCIAAFRSLRPVWAIRVNSPFVVGVSLPLLLQLCALATVQRNRRFGKLASTSFAHHGLGLPSATGACGQRSSVEVLESSKLCLLDADFLGLHPIGRNVTATSFASFPEAATRAASLYCSWILGARKSNQHVRRRMPLLKIQLLSHVRCPGRWARKGTPLIGFFKHFLHLPLLLTVLDMDFLSRQSECPSAGVSRRCNPMIV